MYNFCLLVGFFGEQTQSRYVHNSRGSRFTLLHSGFIYSNFDESHPNLNGPVGPVRPQEDNWDLCLKQLQSIAVGLVVFLFWKLYIYIWYVAIRIFIKQKNTACEQPRHPPTSELWFLPTRRVAWPRSRWSRLGPRPRGWAQRLTCWSPVGFEGNSPETSRAPCVCLGLA